MYTIAMSLPGYYLLKHRNDIYRASKINRVFYAKETLMRSFIGLCLGFGISLYFYGGSNMPKKDKIYDANGEQLDEMSLQYSTI